MSAFEKCQHEECEQAAQFAPQVCVPGKGYPQEYSRALRAIFGLKLCKTHCLEFSATEQFEHVATKDKWQKIFRMLARSTGSSVPPDFERAWVHPLPLDSDDWRAMEKAQAKGLN